MDRLFLSLPNKAFPLPIFSILRFLLLSSLLFSAAFVFASVSINKPLSTQHQCIEVHFSALLLLKQGFDFSGMYTVTTLSSWNPDNRDCCSWEGITCDGATGHVTSLDLSELRISGRIDFVSLFHLQSLQRLNIAHNNFDPSPFPSGFEHLTSLTHLNLSSLKFYGQIPLEISRLTTLVSLDLSHNPYTLELEIPNIGAFFGNLSSLRELHLDSVSISAQGSEWGLALSSALPLLRKLSLRDCGLSGPIHPSLSKLHFLSELYLSGNDLSSVIPKSIFGLPNLQTLDVRYNSLLSAGEIPRNNTIRQLYLTASGFCSNPQDNSYGNFTLLTTLVLGSCYLGGPFPSWLVKLDNLVHLDLSSSGFSGPLPSSFGNLSNLVDLDLSNNGFNGTLPSSLANLNKLVHLDLSYNGFSGPLPFTLANLSNLIYLDLSNSGLSGPLPSSLANLSNLIYLNLYSSGFSGPLPSSLANLNKLVYLDLSSNGFSGPIPSSLFSLPSLRELHLQENQFSGELGEFQNTSSSLLEIIHLYENKLEGPIPRSTFQLTMLTELQLYSNNFSGTIPSLYGNALHSCTELDFSNNSLSGTIPSSVLSLPSLQWLYLQDNQFSGQLGQFHHPSSSLLRTINLDNNKLNGPIPKSIFELPMLERLHLSSNNFSGDLSFPQIEFLPLISFNITDPKFPNVSRFKINLIDISNNRINGEIPNWLWKLGNSSLSYLNLSHNDLEGLEQPFLYHSLRSLQYHSLRSLQYLDLSFNKLKGSIPMPPLFSIFFSLSSNHFSGEVPSLICNCAYLKVLDLSHNRFSGSIPQCLGLISDALIVLNLGGNAFHGRLPQKFKEECILETFDLNGNQLDGQAPSSLARCKKLEVLNLGNNQIHDTFPFWIENLYQLQILILGSNKFHGTIGHPQANQTFPLLQIFDLSNNNFTGKLSSNMFRSWKAMMETKSQSQFLSKTIYNGYYQDKVTIVSKGLEMELVKILTAFTVVDLSNNQFHGDILESVGNLKSLVVLNMSYNHFTGRIPASLGNIKALESLDLSHNSVSGEIPWQLTKLNFLAVLDLSQNLLTGSIPQGQQFNTFTNKSFLGNSGLCGTPLSKKCEHIEAHASPPLAQSESKYDWRSMWIGFGVGYGVGMGILFWTVALWTNGMREFTIFIDKVLMLIFPCEAFSLMHRY